MKIKEYALYKGETLMSIGSIAHISRDTGKSRNMLCFLTYPSYKRRLSERKRQNKGPLEMIELLDESTGDPEI